ncbi:MAG: hypothetical protein ACKOEC_01260 [Acidimicrobiia bacterium]
MQAARSRKRAFFLLLVACCLLLALRPSAQALPRPLGRISDFANVIDPATEGDLDRRIALL